MKYIKLVLISLIVVVPALAFALYKPIRVLIPETFGVSCEQNVCVDDSSQRKYAVALLKYSKETLRAQYGLNLDKPNIIFCSTEKCKNIFGLGKKAAFSLGSFSIAIAPRGWKEHYVAHELIHYWQAENFGSLTRLNGEPWFIEGMAYALSNDPRKKLHEPFESYRNRFTEWHHLHAGIPLIESVDEVL